MRNLYLSRVFFRLNLLARNRMRIQESSLWNCSRFVAKDAQKY